MSVSREHWEGPSSWENLGLPSPPGSLSPRGRQGRSGRDKQRSHGGPRRSQPVGMAGGPFPSQGLSPNPLPWRERARHTKPASGQGLCFFPGRGTGISLLPLTSQTCLASCEMNLVRNVSLQKALLRCKLRPALLSTREARGNLYLIKMLHFQSLLGSASLMSHNLRVSRALLSPVLRGQSPFMSLSSSPRQPASPVCPPLCEAPGSQQRMR